DVCSSDLAVHHLGRRGRRGVVELGGLAVVAGVRDLRAVVAVSGVLAVRARHLGDGAERGGEHQPARGQREVAGALPAAGRLAGRCDLTRGGHTVPPTRKIGWAGVMPAARYHLRVMARDRVPPEGVWAVTRRCGTMDPWVSDRTRHG